MSRAQYSKALTFGVGAAAIVALPFLAGTAPHWVERYYARGWYPALTRPLAWASGRLPFALAEVLAAAALAAGSMWIVLGLWRWRRGYRGPTWRRCLTRVLRLALGAYLAFLLLWGLNYRRPTVGSLLALDLRPAPPAELAELCATLADEAGALRAGLPEDRSGALAWPEGPAALLARVGAGFERLEGLPLALGPSVRPKPLASAALFSRLGISGLYVPFTGEMLVNQQAPAASLPFAACHEAAHAQGFAREDEASFVGYLAARAHPDAGFRYSAAFEALLEALAALRTVDAARARTLGAGLAPGVRRDWQAIVRWVAQYAGPAQDAAQAVNDAYLRSQGQADGVRSYGRVVDLLLAERRARRAARPALGRRGATAEAWMLAPLRAQPRSSSGW